MLGGRGAARVEREPGARAAEVYEYSGAPKAAEPQPLVARQRGACSNVADGTGSPVCAGASAVINTLEVASPWLLASTSEWAPELSSPVEKVALQAAASGWPCSSVACAAT